MSIFGFGKKGHKEHKAGTKNTKMNKIISCSLCFLGACQPVDKFFVAQ